MSEFAPLAITLRDQDAPMGGRTLARRRGGRERGAWKRPGDRGGGGGGRLGERPQIIPEPLF